MTNIRKSAAALTMAAVLAFTVSACGGSDGADTQPTNEPTDTIVEDPSDEPTDIASPEPEVGGITREVANQITDGMSVDEVQALIGTTPTSTTNSEFMGTETSIVMWSDAAMNSITVMFTDGESSAVTFMDLATMNAVADAVNTDNFAALSNGMSVDEVKAVMGVTPTSESTANIAGTDMTTLSWVTMQGSAITVMFMDGSAMSISQLGLE